MRPAAALAVIVALAAAALLADHWQVPAAIAGVLFVLCLRAPASRRWPYLIGCAITSCAVVVITPFLVVNGVDVIWSGPVVPVLSYKRLDDVIDYISGRGKPLALYIYSNNQDNIDRVLSRTSSGGVTINGFFSHYLENQLPFGGVNQSGMGSYHGVFGFKSFSHERAIYIQENR